MIKTAIALIIVFIIEQTLSPRLEWARGDGRKLLVLWYGTKERKFIILW